MSFPMIRLRRLRASGALREIFQEVRLGKGDLVQLMMKEGGVGEVVDAGVKGVACLNASPEWVKDVKKDAGDLAVFVNGSSVEEAIELSQAGSDVILMPSDELLNAARRMVLPDTILASPNLTVTSTPQADICYSTSGFKSLDLILSHTESSNTPTIAVQPHADIAMITEAAKKGWLNREQIVMETLIGYKRAGATAVLTPFAVEAAKAL
eukprot:TRINITY_DN12450_c0_g1_i1.p1 TRINITY_DN12450_c0_g1~~TRINITY_DN12450_c0_g1_i1.p1  ORF type:complete len:210 (+),score=31.94 TRINITY_DN12450_c0_g1_i1:72-701(+)